MKTAMLVAMICALTLAGCQRDHPEAFIRPNAGGFDKITIYPDDPDTRGYVVAQGIWTIDGDDKIATPVNVSTIECYRDDGYCKDYRAFVMTINGTAFLDQDSDVYILDSWEGGQVVAVSEEMCRTIELKIDTVAETVTTVTGNTPGVASCDVMEKPRISRLIASEEHQAIKKAGRF